MSERLSVEGTWPGSLSISRGWSLARARPWNDDLIAGHIRLVRGGADFLTAATGLVAGRGDGTVYSPALYPSAARVWRKSGYALFHRLIVMEASTAARNRVGTSNTVRIVVDPDWARIDIVDRAAFEGFWRLGVAGLRESALATRHSVVLEVEQEASLLGFAIVGAERGVSYLQRIAVTPQHARRGVGSELLSRAIDWARGIGAPIMVLNVREETEPALNLYRTFGFDVTPTRLEILEYRRTPDTLLN